MAPHDIKLILGDRTLQWRQRIAARMLEPNPNFDPNRATELGKAKDGKRKPANE